VFHEDGKSGAVRGRYIEDGKVEQRLEVRKDDKKKFRRIALWLDLPQL
jgi:hypothetical protein